MAALMVFTTLPDLESAVKLANHLVERRCAACVHILPPGRSVFRWEGAIECVDEVTLMIKTSEAIYPLIEREVLGLHPYDVPELIAIPACAGLPAYLEWLKQETA